jgi:hypothetical protein
MLMDKEQLIEYGEVITNRGSKKKVRRRRKKEKQNNNNLNLTESLKMLQKHFHENYSNER